MNSQTDSFQEGKTEYGSGTLEFDVSTVEMEVSVGKECQGSFRMTAHSPVNARGNVYTTDCRLSCPERGFEGKNLEVPFVFNAAGMEPGDVAKGEFYIISNLGEYYLPYEIKITGAIMDSELGEIKNLFHFANLAKVNWKEALRFFVMDEFAQIIIGSGRQYLEAYKGLVENGRESGQTDFAMEQFLILIKKKQAVSFECMTEELFYTKEDVPDTIEVKIRRTGWGYTRLQVQIEGGFLEADRQVLSEEDFENNYARLSLRVHKKMLHMGSNTAVLTLVQGDSRQECRIHVDAASNESARLADRQSKQLTDYMMRLYLDYRTGRRPVQECMTLAEGALENVRGMNELMPALYQTHLKLLMGQNNEAVWLLKHARRMLEGREVPLDIYGYFLYLTAMSEGEDRVRAGELLEQYAAQYPDHFVIYWGYMYKAELQKQNPGIVYRKLKDLWEKGCFQPVLYLEAAMVVLENPAVFSVMDRFEIQLLFFMDRYYLLSPQITDQIFTAAESVKTYHPMLVSLLEKYSLADKKKMTKAMCLQYMRGNCRGKAAAEWLKEGILDDCRITGLYEAYIRALEFDQSEVIPEEVARYFAFDSSLDDRHLAYVYAKVMRQQEDIKADYEERIRKFIIKQLGAGRIDENLAYLYRNICMPEDMDEEMQEQLLNLVFVNELTVFGERYKSCIVRHEGMKKQKRYSLKNNRGLVEIYSGQYTLLFEDEEGFCHCRENGFELRPLLGFERMKRFFRNLNTTSFEAQFYQFTSLPVDRIESVEEFQKAQQGCRWLLKQEEMTEEFRQEFSSGLLRAYGKWNLYDEMDEFLEESRIEDFVGNAKTEFVSTLCTRGFYKKAFEAAGKYGYETVDRRVLARLCQYIIGELDGAYDMQVLKLTYQVFESGKYTESMIEYLAEWFKGTVKQMRSVWKAAASMEVPATAMAERILEQIMLTGAYTADREKIFRYYCENGGRNELIHQYLSMRMEEYLVREEDVEESTFEKLLARMLEGGQFPLGAKLALLKYKSADFRDENEQETELYKAFLQESLGAGIYFSYYKAFTGIYPVLKIYEENSYVEYHSGDAGTVMIHYIVDSGREDGGSYCNEEMKEIYPGIFQKSFKLFYGDILQYYVTKGEEEQAQFVMSGSLEKGETADEGGSGRFHLLNDIALSMELSDYETADTLVLEYARNDFVTGKMLRIK